MGLDLQELIADWEDRNGAAAARYVRAGDGCEFVQMRIELGVLQMAITGRPDGETYRGFPTALAFVQYRLAKQRDVAEDAWQELQREMQQYNSRRLALALLSDVGEDDADHGTERWLRQALDDLEHCAAIIELFTSAYDSDSPVSPVTPATVDFHRTRLRARLLVAENRPDEAIDTLRAGIDRLREVALAVADDDDAEPAPGGSEESIGAEIEALERLVAHLRQRYGIRHTLTEQLDAAVADEDFETAARLRQAIERRAQHAQTPGRKAS